MKFKNVQSKSKPRNTNPPKRKGKNKKNFGASHNATSYSSNFALALRDPFAPTSFGTKVPDPFSFPTTTFHLHGEVILGGSTTSGTAVFYPNPILSMFDCSGCVVAAPTSMSAFPNSIKCYGATVPSQLGADFGTYRVACWGIKISNLIPELSASGRIIIAPFVCADTVPSYKALSSIAIADETLCLNTTGLSYASLNSSSVLNMPDAIELSMQDFLHGSVEIGCSVVNSSFFDFKTAQPNSTYGVSGLNTYNEGDDIVYAKVTTTGSIATGAETSYTAYKDPTRMRGGVGWVIYYEGIPASTANTLLVEYIYHLEGTANIGNGTTKGVPVPSQTPVSFPGTTAEVELAMACNSAPNVMTWIAKGAQFLDKASTAATGKGILAHAQNAARMHPVTNRLMSLAKMFK